MKKSVRNKSKVGISTRIKNIYNNSPWHSAFTYPILYILGGLIFGGLIAATSSSMKNSNELNILDYFAMTFMFSIYLTPIWVFIGLIVSKKKIPYVLSLCIGLGLLAIAIYISLQITSRM